MPLNKGRGIMRSLTGCVDGERGTTGPHGNSRATRRHGGAAGGLNSDLRCSVLVAQELRLPVQVGHAEGVGVCDGAGGSPSVLGQNVGGDTGRVGDGVDHAGRHRCHGHHARGHAGRGRVDGGDHLPSGGRGEGLWGLGWGE